MADTMGHYLGGWTRRLPQREIQRMKKNMKKVPIIQKRAEKYHEKEDKEADEFIATQVQTIN